MARLNPTEQCRQEIRCTKLQLWYRPAALQSSLNSAEPELRHSHSTAEQSWAELEMNRN